MISKDLVSIVVTVYNLEQYIYECLESIVNQVYQELEIIIINDGSHDKSHEIIENFTYRDKRIRYFNRHNSGVSESRNFAIGVSTGKYIVFVDGDDWLELNTIEHLMLYSSLDLVICSYNRCYKDKVKPKILDWSGIYSGVELHRRQIGLTETELYDPSNIDSLGSCFGKLYKRDIILKYEIQFTSLKKIGTAEDVLFNIEYSKYVDKCMVINEPLYNYRKTNLNSITSTYKSNLFEQRLNFFNYVFINFISKNSDLYIAFKNRVCLSIFGLGLNELYSGRPHKEHIAKLRFMLNHELFRSAYKGLKLTYFPIHWKVFFFFAKKRIIIGLYLMLKGVEYFVERNK